jgi:ammonium transporter
LLALTFLLLLGVGQFATGQDKKDPPPKDTNFKLDKLSKDIDELKEQSSRTLKDVVEGTKEAKGAKTEAAEAKKIAIDAEKQAMDAKKEAVGAKTDANDAKKDAGAAKKLAEDLKSQIEKKEPAPKQDDETKKAIEKLTKDLEDAKNAAKDASEAAKTEGSRRGDTAWMLISSALVLLMVPGLALFYGGMVRRKNILATMMQSYAAMSVVGLFWVVAGYGLAFGPSLLTVNLFGVENGGIVGWSWDLFCLQGVKTDDYLAAYNIPVYVHVMFQGMFAIITPALISGAIAERIRFWPFTLFMLAWVAFVYCPLAHMVWAFDFFSVDPVDATKGLGGSAIGLLGKMGALDFAGGTVVHIAAGVAGLACAIVLRRRHGYPGHAMHPNSMVLTLLGAGVLWVGWFGFNGGSALMSNPLAGSAFTATQIAAAAAGFSWVFVEWLFKGKPTALGMASGIVAGLVAITPASGYVFAKGAIVIGLLAGVVCYFAVQLKTLFKYDDSLDAFGVHAVGGFLGAVLTGLFCYAAVNSAGADGFFAIKDLKGRSEGIKKELEPLKKEIEDATKALEGLQASVKAEEGKIAESEAKLKVVEGTLEKATGKAKTDAEKKLAEDKAKLAEEKEAFTKLGDEVKAAEGKLKRRTDKQGKLRDELVTTIGGEEVGKWIESKEAEKLGLSWTKEEWEKASGEAGTLKKLEKDNKGPLTQFMIQVKAAVFATAFSFALSLILALAIQLITLGNFTTTIEKEVEGLDQTEHGETGFDFGSALDTIPTGGAEPRPAKVPPGTNKRFDVLVEGVENGGLRTVWSELCRPSDAPVDSDFKAIYPYVTTLQGNRFRLRGGDPKAVIAHFQSLLQKRLGKQIKVRVIEG